MHSSRGAREPIITNNPGGYSSTCDSQMTGTLLGTLGEQLLPASWQDHDIIANENPETGGGSSICQSIQDAVTKSRSASFLKSVWASYLMLPLRERKRGEEGETAGRRRGQGQRVSVVAFQSLPHMLVFCFSVSSGYSFRYLQNTVSQCCWSTWPKLAAVVSMLHLCKF